MGVEISPLSSEMRALTTLLALLGCSSLTVADQTSINVLWTDNWLLGNPVADENGTALAVGSVMQLGYFADPAHDKDPADYSAADWASFVPMTGNGSRNPDDFPHSIIGAGDGPPGFFSYGVTFFDSDHEGFPLSQKRAGIRFYNAATVEEATFSNIVTASDSSWILPTPGSGANVPTPAEASLDVADLTATLSWLGTPFRTDVLPTVPEVTLTGVSKVDGTTLQIAWDGGDGTNNIEVSSDGINWTARRSDVASPANLTIDAAEKTLLIRVVEP